MVIKAGKFGLFLACSGYPECENTRELETPEPGADGEGLGGGGEKGGRPPARTRDLPRLQVRQAEVHGARLPEGRRRRRRAQVAPREGVLRLRELSGLRLR